MENKKTKKNLTGQAAIECCSGSTAPTARRTEQWTTRSAERVGRLLRAQAATEILVLAGFALAFILPIAFLFLSASSTELGKSSLLQAKISARTIADEAGEIYLQGPGAKKFIYVNFPEGVVNGSAEGGLVVLTVESEGRRQDVVSQTFANISGLLSGKRTSGLQRLKLEYVSAGEYVNISYNDTG